MLLDKLKKFHEKTLSEYNRQHLEEAEPWKKQVLALHEQSHFLFYYDSCELEKADGSELLVQGEAAKGEMKEGGHLYLYDGQGRLLGEGLLLSDPYTKEEKRRGFLRSRKNEFLLKLVVLEDKEYSSLKGGEKNKAFQHLLRTISLLSDVHISYD